MGSQTCARMHSVITLCRDCVLPLAAPQHPLACPLPCPLPFASALSCSRRALEPLSSALLSAVGSSSPPLSPPLSLSAAAQRCGGGDSRPHHASHCLFLSRGSTAISAAVPDPASEKPWLPVPCLPFAKWRIGRLCSGGFRGGGGGGRAFGESPTTLLPYREKKRTEGRSAVRFTLSVPGRNVTGFLG